MRHDSNIIIHDCRACVTRELTVEFLAARELELQDQNALLGNENYQLRERNAGLERDLSWAMEILRASLDQQHAAHVRSMRQREQIRELLEALRAVRESSGPGSPMPPHGFAAGSHNRQRSAA
jgi:hypothetical protein